MYVVEGASMEPTINFGDLVVLKTMAPELSREGKIVLFKRFGVSTVHRIVSIEEDCIVTKGDNTDPDPNISSEYLFRIPFLGYLFLGIQLIPRYFVTGMRVILDKL